mmetsp:Transcript_14359/g.27348  ORF Transcript_14359/g.27348 Transcript_14359/m.27348 type:complete len:684 (+) Transcript_14359:19-2070(+)
MISNANATMGSTAGQVVMTPECAVSSRKANSRNDSSILNVNGGKGCHPIDDCGDDNTSSSSSSGNKTPSDGDDGDDGDDGPDRKKLHENHGISKTNNNGNNADNNNNNGKAMKNRSANAPSANTPKNNATKANARQLQPQPNNIQTITINIEDVASSIVSIVDPWVPRIRNNDEYLQKGLDLSPKIIPTILNQLNTDDNTDDNTADNTDANDGENENGTSQRERNYHQSTKISPLVGNVGATRLSYALSYNTHLLTLNLSRNDIGVEGGVALAESLYGATNANNENTNGRDAFRSKTALRVLNLSHNLIANDGAYAFSRALRHNTSLAELKLSDNKIGLEGMQILMLELKDNVTLKRMGLVDNIQRNLSREEMTTFAWSVGRLLRKGVSNESALEVLETHCTCTRIDSRTGSSSDGDGDMIVARRSPSGDDGTDVDDANGRSAARDNFDGLHEADARHLERSIFGMDEATSTTHSPHALESIKLKHHRMRTLTLPGDGYDDGGDSRRVERRDERAEKERIARRLRRILRFNAYYRPVLQRRDILNSPLAQAEAALNVPIKLPHRLRRDGDDDGNNDGGGSGALIALLPSSFSDARSSKHAVDGAANGNDTDARRSSSSRPSSSKGVEYRLMPRVLSFACEECMLDVVWNLVRYRPDVFCCTGGGMGVVECAPCGGGGGGCCIS